jgi:hypothetical protein
MIASWRVKDIIKTGFIVPNPRVDNVEGREDEILQSDAIPKIVSCNHCFVEDNLSMIWRKGYARADTQTSCRVHTNDINCD